MENQTPAEALPATTELINIPWLVDQSKKKKIENWPCRANYASRAGEECLRKLTYEWVRWNDKIKHDVGLQYIFDEGTRIEKSILTELSEAGIELIEGQRRYEHVDAKISGRIDGKLYLAIDGHRLKVPVELKSINPYAWDAIVPERVESILFHKSEHVRGYVGQLMLYMYLDTPRAEYGILLFKNKSTGRYKQVTIRLDVELAEKIIAKFKLVNRHVWEYEAAQQLVLEYQKKTDEQAQKLNGGQALREDLDALNEAREMREATLPERIKDLDKCKRCAFRHICLPDMDFNTIVDIRTDAYLNSLIETAYDARPHAQGFAEADERIKELVKGYAEANMLKDKETLFVVNERWEVMVKKFGKGWRVTYSKLGQNGQESGEE